MNQNLDKYLQHDVHIGSLYYACKFMPEEGFDGHSGKYSFSLQIMFTLENTLDGRVFKTLNQEPLDSQRGYIRTHSQCVSESTKAHFRCV